MEIMAGATVAEIGGPGPSGERAGGSHSHPVAERSSHAATAWRTMWEIGAPVWWLRSFSCWCISPSSTMLARTFSRLGQHLLPGDRVFCGLHVVARSES